ncbi:MAG TPA: universal stress protein [Caulobacteraceae bacterium]
MPRTTKISWARIMAPLSGGKGDAAVLAAAAELARPFGAEVSGVYAPADVADLMPWMGEGFMGGVQISAVESLKEAASVGEANARAAVAACPATDKDFTTLDSPIWASLAVESRLSDVVVFDNEAARGKGPLAEAFQQLVANEQRPTVIARPGLNAEGVMAVAWDGGKEATRATRTAMPLLEKASRVVILGAPAASSRDFASHRLQDFLAVRGIQADVEIIKDSGDAAAILLGAARSLGASLLVSGAFGHARLREFIFGGTTRSLLQADSPSLFLSH